MVFLDGVTSIKPLIIISHAAGLHRDNSQGWFCWRCPKKEPGFISLILTCLGAAELIGTEQQLKSALVTKVSMRSSTPGVDLLTKLVAYLEQGSYFLLLPPPYLCHPPTPLCQVGKCSEMKKQASLCQRIPDESGLKGRLILAKTNNPNNSFLRSFYFPSNQQHEGLQIFARYSLVFGWAQGPSVNVMLGVYASTHQWLSEQVFPLRLRLRN